MAAALITKLIKDGIGGLLPRRLIDASGDGSGPFTAIIAPGKPDGSGPVDLEALNQAVIDAIEAGAGALPTGAASDASLAAILAKITSDPATQTTLAAVLAKLSADPATQTTSAAILAKLVAGIPLTASSAVIGQVGGLTKVAGATLARPANTTAYALGDLIANSATAGSVTPLAIAAARENDATGMLRKVRLSTDNVAWANNTVRVHLFKNSPTSAVGDNGVFSGAVNGVAAIHLGYFDVIFDQVFSDGVKGEGVPNTGGEINFEPAAGTPNIYALLEVRGAYTPASGQAFALAVEVLQN